MKTKKPILGMTLISFAFAMTLSTGFANDEQYLDSDPIDVNGYVKEEANVTDAELENVKNELRKQKGAIKINKEKGKTYKKLSKSTEKLADVTEEMIEERKESQETIDKYNKKIDCLMNDNKGDECAEFVKGDRVSMKQAAPVVQAEAPAPAPRTLGKIKLLPFTGLTTIASENENVEAGISGGIKVESDINDKISVGAGFGYMSLSTQDISGSGYIAPGYQPYYNDYYSGREIEYKKMNLSLYGKYFMVTASRFRPYIGAGLGYNRTSMEYTDNRSANPYNGYNYRFGSEEVIASALNLELMLGSEVTFTDKIGMNVELNYMKGIGSGLSSENGISRYNAPDQQRLEDLSAELNDAHIISLFAGLLVKF